MPWEARHGRPYFYRNLRVDGRAIKRYEGAGLAGEIAEVAEKEAKWLKTADRDRFRELTVMVARNNRWLRQLEVGCGVLIDGTLLAEGFVRGRNGDWRHRGRQK